jgi:DNA polymerase
MFDADKLLWLDFETASTLDLKAVGTFRYADDASTRAIVLAYAVGDEPAQAWHTDGAILSWRDAPEDLRAAVARGATIAAWNASFDSAIWNYATLGFPFLEPERVIDAMIQAGVSNLPTDLESASRALGGAGKQKDGKKLIRLFCVENADPRERPAEWKRFLAYACQDVEAMRDVYRRTRFLPLEEWNQYWAFEHINRRGVAVDVPFITRAAALATEDAVAIGRRLVALTDGDVTTVNQAQRIAAWVCDHLPDAAMREVLVTGAEENGECSRSSVATAGSASMNRSHLRLPRSVCMAPAPHQRSSLAFARSKSMACYGISIDSPAPAKPDA